MANKPCLDEPKTAKIMYCGIVHMIESIHIESMQQYYLYFQIFLVETKMEKQKGEHKN